MSNKAQEQTLYYIDFFRKRKLLTRPAQYGYEQSGKSWKVLNPHYKFKPEENSSSARKVTRLCVLWRKRDNWLESSSYMISWEYITVILAICNHWFFPHNFTYTSFFSGHSAMSNEERINLKFLALLWKTPSQAFKVLQQVYGDNTMIAYGFLRSIRDS